MFVISRALAVRESLLKLDAKVPGTLHYGVPIGKDLFLELMHYLPLPPNFIDALINNNGVFASNNAFSPATKNPGLNVRRILIKLPNKAPPWSTIHDQYDVWTASTTTLIIGSRLAWIESALMHAFSTPTPGFQHDDPFDILATIFADFSELTDLKRLAVDHKVLDAEDLTGLSPLRGREIQKQEHITCQSTLYLQRMGGHIHFVDRTTSFQADCLAVLLHQHRTLTRKRLRQHHDESEDHHKITVSAEKTRYSMELSAFYARNRGRQLLELIYRIEMQVKTVDNLIVQRERRANLATADRSRMIAIDTKRNSIAMKMIAALTMVILPGTFVATIFSMVFSQVEQEDKHVLKVSPNWWLYLAVTVPLTAAVLTIWIVWLKWKVRSKVEPLIATDSEKRTNN